MPRPWGLVVDGVAGGCSYFGKTFNLCFVHACGACGARIPGEGNIEIRCFARALGSELRKVFEAGKCEESLACYDLTYITYHQTYG